MAEVITHLVGELLLTDKQYEKVVAMVEGLQHELDWFKTNYEAEKIKFIEKAELNPAYAVQWADSMVTAQGWFEASHDLAEQNQVDAGLEDYGAVIANTKEHVARLEQQIRRTHGQSTSGFSNAVDYAKHMAVVRVLERCESWLESLDRRLEQ